MGYIVYNVLITIFYYIYFIYSIFSKLIFKNNKINFFRLGFMKDKKILKNLRDNKIIWVHASSVGEVNSIVKTVEVLKKEEKEYKILVTTMTETGQKAAKSKTLGDYFFILPFDKKNVMKGLMRKIKPKALIITETELWPNFLFEADKVGAKLFLISGTVSDKSKKIYLKYAKKLIKKTLSLFTFIGVQSKKDYENILELGVENKKVYLSGDTKFDNLKKMNEKEKQDLKNRYGISEEKVFLAGSTREKEEEFFLNLYKNIEIKDFILILAPRHLNRVEYVENLCKEYGFDFIKKTEIEKRKKEQVIIIDTLGELAALYSIADISFVGGTLADIGGHSVWEAVVQSKPILFGPYTYGHSESYEIVEDKRIGFRIETEEEAEKIIMDFYNHSSKFLEVKEKAEVLLKEKLGATYKNLEEIRKFL